MPKLDAFTIEAKDTNDAKVSRRSVLKGKDDGGCP
jgi:hypothetical protein